MRCWVERHRRPECTKQPAAPAPKHQPPFASASSLRPLQKCTQADSQSGIAFYPTRLRRKKFWSPSRDRWRKIVAWLQPVQLSDRIREAPVLFCCWRFRQAQISRLILRSWVASALYLVPVMSPCFTASPTGNGAAFTAAMTCKNSIDAFDDFHKVVRQARYLRGRCVYFTAMLGGCGQRLDERIQRGGQPDSGTKGSQTGTRTCRRTHRQPDEQAHALWNLRAVRKAHLRKRQAFGFGYTLHHLFQLELKHGTYCLPDGWWVASLEHIIMDILVLLA